MTSYTNCCEHFVDGKCVKCGKPMTTTPSREAALNVDTTALREAIRKSRAFDKSSVMEKLALCAFLESACDAVDELLAELRRVREERDNEFQRAQVLANELGRRVEEVSGELVAGQQARLVDLQVRVSALEGALERYGKHDEDCQYEPPEYDHVGTQQTRGRECSCGWHKLLAARGGTPHA